MLNTSNDLRYSVCVMCAYFKFLKSPLKFETVIKFIKISDWKFDLNLHLYWVLVLWCDTILHDWYHTKSCILFKNLTLSLNF